VRYRTVSIREVGHSAESSAEGTQNANPRRVPGESVTGRLRCCASLAGHCLAQLFFSCKADTFAMVETSSPDVHRAAPAWFRKRKFWLWLGIPTAGLVLFVFLIGFAGVFQIALKHAETNEFCTSCHEMTIPQQEYMQSAHFTNQFGARAGCANCHVPPTFFSGLIRHAKASVEVYEHFRGELDTPAKYETHRLELAQNVWSELKANDSAECRSCHTPSAMVLAAQPPSAAAAHASLAGTKGETCIDCHRGLVHALPPNS